MTPNTTTKKSKALSTKTDDGLPVWPQARTIDGYVYELESTHATVDAAQKRVEEVRGAGDAAQAFQSGRPKFASAGQVKGEAAYFAHAAAVYRVPAGKLGRLEGDGVAWSDRPPRTPPVTAKKAKKATKAKGDDAKPMKQRIKERLAAEKAAKAQAPTAA